MNYIVLDLEWNQCPQGKRGEDPRLPFEIIEFGAVRLSEDLEITDTFREIVRPQVYTTLHFRTRQVVHLRETDFAGKRTFPEIFSAFLDWCGPDPAFCIWGSSDLTELQRNIAWHGMEAPFPWPFFYYDVQKLFSIVYEDRKTRRSLEWAAHYLSLPEEEEFHDAFADAFYTARILQKIPPEVIRENSSIDYYRTPQTRKEEISVQYPGYRKFISRPFRDRHEAIRDRVVASTRCIVCGQNARKKIRWFSSGRNYQCLAWCEEHGWLKGKARMRQDREGRTYVVKTLKLITPEEALDIREKQEILRVKRRIRRQAGD